MKHNLLELIVKYNGSVNRIVKETGLERENLYRIFEELKLEKGANGRKLFIWKLVFFTDHTILANPFANNNDIAEIIVKTWNSSSDIKINREVIQAYLQRSPLRLDNSKRAFQALCSGDIDSYKMFSQNDAVFFSEMMVRFSLYFVEKERDILPLAFAVLPALFENIDVNKVMNLALDNLGFKHGRGNNYEAMSLYTRSFSVEEAVFGNGLKSIILSTIEKNAKGDELKKIYEKMAFLSQTQVSDDSETDEFSINDLLDFEPEAEAQPVEVDHGAQAAEAAQEPQPVESNEGELADAATGEDVVEVQEEVLTEETKEKQSSVDFLTKIANLTDVFQQNVKEAVAEYSKSVPEDKPDDSYILQLEEENRRLYAHVEKLEQEREELQERKITEFIKLIGGKESRYLLSHLYEVSTGKKEEDYKISVGKVQNLFNFFQMFGIEPFSFGFQLGQEISVSKPELAQKYNVSGVIASEENEVNVRIIHHGWIFDGKMVVLPLVEEIIPVKQ